MKTRLFAAGAVLALALPVVAGAQDVLRGGSESGEEGYRVAGPVGAIVGGSTGAVLGGVVGSMLGANQQLRFRAYVAREHHPSYAYDGAVVVGVELPAAGVAYYEIPSEYGVRDFRYAIVNDRTVLVDPRTHRIVAVIE